MNKDCWDKTKVVFEIIFGLIIGGIKAFYGHQINANLKQKELNIKMIEVAIDILTTKPSQKTDPLREWAIEIINKYSEIPLSEEAKKELKKRPIKEGSYLLTENGNRLLTESGDPIVLSE